MSGIGVRGVEQRDIPRLADVLALAFYDDPVMRWATREDEKRLPALTDLYTQSLEHDIRYGWVTTTDDLKHAPYGSHPKPPRNQHPSSTPYACSPTTSAGAVPERSGRWLNFIALCEEKRPKTPHHYLDFIGVHPDRQGQGYASALLRHTLTKLDILQAPAYLESSNPRNNPLYQRNDFIPQTKSTSQMDQHYGVCTENQQNNTTYNAY